MNHIEPARVGPGRVSESEAGSSTKQSVRGSGGRKAVLAALGCSGLEGSAHQAKGRGDGSRHRETCVGGWSGPQGQRSSTERAVAAPAPAMPARGATRVQSGLHPAADSRGRQPVLGGRTRSSKPASSGFSRSWSGPTGITSDRCACVPWRPSVYITCLGGKFVLKRMPCTGSHHAVDCPHFEPLEELPDSTDIGTAISEDPYTGYTNLDVDFSLSCDFETRSHRAEAGAANVHSTDSRLSLRGLLQFLWSEADLTMWRPAFAGNSWAVVRHHLLRAAAKRCSRASTSRT